MLFRPIPYPLKSSEFAFQPLTRRPPNVDWLRPRLQLDTLQAAGGEKFFTDQASGQKLDRADLVDALAFAREGDTLVVWKLGRLGLDQ